MTSFQSVIQHGVFYDHGWTVDMYWFVRNLHFKFMILFLRHWKVLYTNWNPVSFPLTIFYELLDTNGLWLWVLWRAITFALISQHLWHLWDLKYILRLEKKLAWNNATEGKMFTLPPEDRIIVLCALGLGYISIKLFPLFNMWKDGDIFISTKSPWWQKQNRKKELLLPVYSLR